MDFSGKMLRENYSSKVISRFILFIIMVLIPYILNFLYPDLMLSLFLIIVILTLIPYLLLIDLSGLYVSLSNDFFTSIEKICKAFGENAKIKDGLIYDFNVFYNKKTIFTELVMILVFLRVLPLYFFDYPFLLDGLYIALVILLSHSLYLIVYPDIEPKSSLKAFGYIDIYESHKRRLLMVLIVSNLGILFILRFKNYLNTLGLTQLTNHLLAFIFLLEFYYVSKGISVITIAARKTHESFNVLVMLFAFLSIFSAIYYYSYFEIIVPFEMLYEQTFFSLLIVNFLLAMLIGTGLIIKAINSLLTQHLTSYSSPTPIIKSIEVNYTFYRVSLPLVSIFLICVSPIYLNLVKLDNIIGYISTYLGNFTILPYSLILIFALTAVYTIYKTLDFFVEEINKTEERCKELERVRKRRAERKIKKRKKERKKEVEKELVRLEDIERYLDEFDSLFGEV